MHDWNTLIIYAAMTLLFVVSILLLACLVRFSSILVKLIVVEVYSNLLMAGIAIWALIYEQPIFIDICLPLALVMFLGVVAYYQFLINKEHKDVELDR